MIDIYETQISHRFPGREGTALMQPHLNNASFGVPVIALQRAVVNGANKAKAMLDDQHSLPQVHRNYRDHYQPEISKAARLLHKELIQRNNANNEIIKNAIAPKSAIGEGRIAITLQFLASMKQTDIITLMHEDRDVSAIVFQNYRLLKLPAEARAELERSVAERNIARNFEATIASRPTMDDMLGENVDYAEATKLAKAEMRKVTGNRNEINGGLAWMRSVLDHVAAMSDQPVAATWSAMMDAG